MKIRRIQMTVVLDIQYEDDETGTPVAVEALTKGLKNVVNYDREDSGILNVVAVY